MKISVGQRVHCILYGGKDGTVTAIHGEQAPASVRNIAGGIGVMGGNAYFDIIWDNGTESPGIPESLLRGSVQWGILSDIYGETQIAEARAHLAIETARRKAKADEAAARFEAQCDRLRAERPDLKRREDEENSFKRAVKNIRLDLKKRWPKVKFSVRTEYYGSVSIRWTDGPTRREVDRAVDQYQAGHFNGMEDIYEHSETPWTTVFGGAKYVSTCREYSDNLLAFGLDKLYECLPTNLKDVPRPTVEMLKGYGHCPLVPHLHISVCEGARGLVEVYDCTTGVFAYEGYYRLNWLVDDLIAAQGSTEKEV